MGDAWRGARVAKGRRAEGDNDVPGGGRRRREKGGDARRGATRGERMRSEGRRVARGDTWRGGDTATATRDEGASRRGCE
jgi:hypothetical protein